MEKLEWLLPKYFDFTEQSFDTQLSTVFVTLLLAITILFLVKSFISYFNASQRVSWLFKILNKTNEASIEDLRTDLLLAAKEKRKKDREHSVAHLWQEFDETLIEVRKNGKTQLYNTLDAAHFFNTSTLAKGVTENRLIAAVPGFLTAIGVIGTFVGLQLGLSEMNISADVTVDEMKAGVSSVIGGAKIAFMTSVWGVALSVCFNFIEKLLEQSIRAKINIVQDKIDEIFPRLSPEAQLQVIAENSSESRESLQGLAEKIGDKMQESMTTATQGIIEALATTLNDIMAPAIDKLVNGASEGNEKALENLLEKFMEGFGAQGKEQKASMEEASNGVNDAIDKMNKAMNDFIERMKESNDAAGSREKALIEGISDKVNILVSHNEEQTKALSDLLNGQIQGLKNQAKEDSEKAKERELELTTNIGSQITSLVNHMSEQTEALTNFVQTYMNDLKEFFETGQNRDKQLTDTIRKSNDKQREEAAKHTAEIAKSTQQLLEQIGSSINKHQQSAERVLEQGKSLQISVEKTIESSAEASLTMRESASQMRDSAESMKLLGSHMKDAGNRLSGAITEAADTTKDLANQNQLSSDNMEKLREQLIQDTAQFKELANHIDAMISNAGNTFDSLKTSQKEYLTELKANVNYLSERMTQLLSDYAERANSQTTQHLDVWANSTTQYAESMNSAARALSGVVDEIQDKVGA